METIGSSDFLAQEAASPACPTTHDIMHIVVLPPLLSASHCLWLPQNTSLFSWLGTWILKGTGTAQILISCTGEIRVEAGSKAICLLENRTFRDQGAAGTDYKVTDARALMRVVVA